MTFTDPNSPSYPQFRRSANQADVVEAARQRFVDVVTSLQQGRAKSVDDDGFVRIVLTGGGVGTALLSALADDSGDIDWNRVLVFFGDERFVAADSSERNSLAAMHRLLNPVGVPRGNVFEFASTDSGVSPRQAADLYASILAEKARNGFDLHLLGMGGEGHINSIFPHSAAFAERERLVVDVHNCPKPPPTRITLTMPAIASSARVWLLVAGAEKAEAIRAIASQEDAQKWPAAGVRGIEETLVFVDEAAAAQL